MPKLDKLQDLNINKMNDFYLSCLKGTRTLPLFVKNISTEKNDANIDIAFNYLISLCNAFYCSINNKSIISQAASDYSESFCSMIGKFSKAGMDASKILPMKYILNIEASQDFISYPSINIPYLPSDSWNIKVPLSDDYIYSTMSTTFNGAHVGEFKEQNKEPQLLDFIHPDDNTNVNINTIPNQDNGTPIFASLSIPKLLDDQNDDVDSDSDSDSSEIFEKKSELLKERTISLNKESVELSDENLDGVLSNFSEYDSIKASILLMKNMNEMPEITINKISPSFDKITIY